MFLKSLSNRLKDVALQFIAARIVSHYHLNKLGHMTKLQIDSEKSEVVIELDLHGEPAPIELKMHYRLLSATEIEIGEVSSSRSWIATLVNEMVPAEKKRITVPEAVTKALSKLIH